MKPSGTMLAERPNITTPRRSSVDGCWVRGWKILVRARAHLCARVMERGDVAAWWTMADISDDLLRRPAVSCQFPVQLGSVVDAVECGRDVVVGTEFCTKHQQPEEQ